MAITIDLVCSVVEGHFICRTGEASIVTLAYDSRRLQHAATALFFAITTSHNDGHRFIEDAYRKGVRNFVVEKPVPPHEDCNIILVEDTVAALQSVATWHRNQFHLPVIGITGSNGKTIVKDWLYQLLHDEYNIVRSPKSYNSQVGVPLSIWQIAGEHTLGIFEAGISTRGEMQKLRQVIEPTIGVITNLGEAHDAGFSSREEKLREKLHLFAECKVVIGNYELVKGIEDKPLLSWSWEGEGDVTLVAKSGDRTTTIAFKHGARGYVVTIPFTDAASIENAITCFCVLLYLDKVNIDILGRFEYLHTVDMRLQLVHGINNCLLVNDSYSADPTSLKIALDFLVQQGSGKKKRVILSDFAESGKDARELYKEVSSLLHNASIDSLVGIGEQISNTLPALLNKNIEQQYYTSTGEFVRNERTSAYLNEIILVKGGRRFRFERIVEVLEQKVHQTRLEIDLNALGHNIKEYKKLLQPGTKVMAMVKAFSYGSGGAEIASQLQFNNIDYLGVAYTDEGADLVRAGISIPVLVMNTEASSFSSIVEYNLQPVLYSFDIYQRFNQYLKDAGVSRYPVHIEVETGMNRLGFSINDIEQLCSNIGSEDTMEIQSVFSHLVASEDASQDAFTFLQVQRLKEACEIIKKCIQYPFLVHIANSAAIVRHSDLQLNMVRLGIGMYGIESDAEHKLSLEAVASLRSTIAQLKHVAKGESISYNRRGVVQRDSLIATIRIGYADGYSRQFGNGVGKMMVKGKLAPVIGTICMDMTMIDVTDIENVKEGDEVLVFGKALPVQHLAKWINTIPYEILTSVSQRVKRVYYQE